MLKYKILGVLNIPVCIYFILSLFAILNEYFENKYYFSLGEIAQLISVSVLFLWHALISFKLLIEGGNERPFFLYLILSFCPIFYIMLFIGGYFLANSLIFQVCFLILIYIIYFSFKRYSKTLSLSLSLLAFFALLSSFIGGFKDSYCWEKGRQADSSYSAMLIATKDDEDLLTNFKVGKEGSMVGVNFINQIRCRKTFNFIDAIKDNYSFLK